MKDSQHQFQVSINEVGILVVGYNRPELLEKRLLELKNCGAINLYVSIDGGSESHTRKMEELKEFANRLFDNIQIQHHKENLGLVKHITSEITRVLAIHKYIIVVEDDIKISNKFYINVINGLTQLNKNNVNGVVSGYSPIFRRKFHNYWRKTHVCYFWGWACSQETWKFYDYNLINKSLDQGLSKSKAWTKLNSYQKKFWLSRFQSVQSNPLSTWDYQFIYISFVNNFTNLAPIFSITGNEGFNDPRSVHNQGIKPKNIKNDHLNEGDLKKIVKNSRLFGIIDMDHYFQGLKIKIKIESKKLFKSQPLQYP